MGTTQRIFDAGEQRRNATKLGRHLADEGNAAAAADEHRLGAVAVFERAERRGKQRMIGGTAPGAAGGLATDGEVHSDWNLRTQVRFERGSANFRIHIRHDAHADARPRVIHHHVAGASAFAGLDGADGQ